MILIILAYYFSGHGPGWAFWLTALLAMFWVAVLIWNTREDFQKIQDQVNGLYEAELEKRADDGK